MKYKIIKGSSEYVEEELYNEEINLTIFGMPNDICWGCLQEPQKKEIISENVKKSKH